MLTVRQMAGTFCVGLAILATSLFIKDSLPAHWWFQVGWIGGYLAALCVAYLPDPVAWEEPEPDPIIDHWADPRPIGDFYVIADGDFTTDYKRSSEHPHRTYVCPKCLYRLRTNQEPGDLTCWRDDEPLVEVDDEA